MDILHLSNEDYTKVIAFIYQPKTLANLSLRAAFNAHVYTYDDWIECHTDEELQNLYLMDHQKYYLEFKSAAFYFESQADLYKEYQIRSILSWCGNSVTFDSRAIKLELVS